ncbi:MAG: glutaredoxin domain-containing protein [Nitrospirota bacterium]|nr:glutaredoxin domain-containing protein [Nitrospirota bacterium]
MGRTAGLSVISLFFIVMISMTIVSAEIYQWKDSNGKIVYGDAPPSGSDAKEKKLPQQRIDRPVQDTEIRSRSVESRTESRPPRDVSIIMYVTSWCPYCKKARDFIGTLPGVRFVEYDIESSKARNAEMLAKSGGSKAVPLIDVEGTIIRGYNPSAISAAVSLAQKR